MSKSKSSLKLSIDSKSKENDRIPSGILEADWQEMLEEEEKFNIILGIREEIVKKVMDTIYERYMETQAISFSVHCIYLAMSKLINWTFQSRDPGDYGAGIETDPSWLPDIEPAPVMIDSWVGHSMGFMVPEEKKPPEKDLAHPSRETNAGWIFGTFVSPLVPLFVPPGQDVPQPVLDMDMPCLCGTSQSNPALSMTSQLSGPLVPLVPESTSLDSLNLSLQRSCNALRATVPQSLRTLSDEAKKVFKRNPFEEDLPKPNAFNPKNLPSSRVAVSWYVVPEETKKKRKQGRK